MRDIINYPILTDDEINNILDDPKLKYSIKLYKFIQEEINNNGLSLEDNIPFRSSYESLYKLSEGIKHQINKDAYFRVFESIRNNKNIIYDEALQKINDAIKHNNQNNDFKDHENQKVFASKMLHTINNDEIIMDMNVSKCFGIRYRTSPQFSYDYLKNNIMEYLDSHEEAKRIIKLFDLKYPNNGISDVKKIDFVLWIYGGKQ